LIVIPAIDMKGGQCVRLFQGEFNQQTKYSDDPVAVARDFEKLGCPILHMVDLDGARSGDQKNRAIVRQVASQTSFEIQLGGGIRDVETIKTWLDGGVSRCVIGSLAIDEPNLVKGWLTEFGADRIVLALDVRINDAEEPLLSTHGWTRDAETSLWQCVDAYREHGLRHVLCTDISRDGAMSGPNVDLYREFIGRYPEIHLQASGGVRDVGDLEQLRTAGAAAAISGRALLDGRISKEEISSFLRAV
jgi:phosphoribosylformimino-5-aminoimidazole carboxamide ribotide isomerase